MLSLVTIYYLLKLNYIFSFLKKQMLRMQQYNYIIITLITKYLLQIKILV